jgi:two-component system, chemotaxis family, protein-glutamate methylesterase/glutaminase
MENLGAVTQFTCPECHGSLWRIYEGKILRFRCRTGHAYTAESLLADLSEYIEDSLWTTIRSLEENAALMRHIHDHLREQGDGEVAERYLLQAEQAEDRAQQVRASLNERSEGGR